jgi:hypothetical protein
MPSILETQMRKDREAALFKVRMEHFSKTWAPIDRDAAAHFHAELFALVRQIYADAQEPLFKHVMQLTATMPTMPAFYPQPEKK